MAAANETPRQKMIGMMYLVLTALLALQVNSAILLKFKFIDDSLTDVNAKTDRAAANTVESIKAAVAKNHNQASDMAALKASEDIHAKTQEMVAYLSDVRSKLLAATENSKGKNDYKNMSAEDKVAITMLGGKQNGMAYPMQKQLNDYSEYIKQYVPDARPLAQDAKDDDRIAANSEQKHKSFAELNFENTPLVAALAVLSQKETEVLKYQADALAAQAAKVGVKNIVFDKLGAFASAESNTVAAGTKYKADLFLTAGATGLKQNMTFNGSPIAVGPDGHGKIEFTARPGNFDASGNAKASWTGAIKIDRGGRDTTFRVTVPYTITKPVMQIQSASVQALYYQCGNKLSVQVPALGAQYQPAFSASGASVITGQKGEVTLVPNAREVTLNVSSGGNAIGSQEFKVRPVPNPTIKCYAGGSEVNLKAGTPSSAIRTITLKAIPDPGFATFLPDDAHFRVSHFQAVLARGKRPVIGPKDISGAQANFGDMVDAAREGDRLFIEVKRVQRQTLQGNVVDVNMPDVTFNVPLQ